MGWFTQIPTLHKSLTFIWRFWTGSKVKPDSLTYLHRTLILELSFNSTWLLVGSWLFCLQILPCLVNFWCMRGGSVEVWIKDILYWFMEDQTHFGMSRGAKMSLAHVVCTLFIYEIPKLNDKWLISSPKYAIMSLMLSYKAHLSGSLGIGHWTIILFLVWLQPKVDNSYSVTFNIRAPIFEWYVQGFLLHRLQVKRKAHKVWN
jgi:hypothetical protein